MKKLLLPCLSLLFLAVLTGRLWALETNTLTVPELIRLGRAELASRRWESAVRLEGLASQAESTNSTAFALLGYGLAKLDRHWEAVAAFENALALNPQRTNTWFYLGESYFALDNYGKAIDAYKTYVSLQPNGDSVYYRLYYSLCRLDRYDEAERFCQQAISVDPSNSIFWVELGYCQAQLKHYQPAIVSLRQSLSLNPDDAEAYLWLGVSQASLKAYKDAVTSLQRCVSLQPTNFVGHYRLGSSLYMLHRYDEAAISYQKAQQIRPDNFTVNYWLGRNFSELGSLNEAANAFQRAIQIRPDDFSANDWCGITLVKLGRLGEAAASFEKAYDIRQDDKSLRLELLLCYLASSKYEKAYRLYPGILVVGGGIAMLAYLIGLVVLLRYSFRLAPQPFPGLGFSLAWLALFFEGQLAFISCLALLSFLGISQGFLLGITFAAIPVIIAAARIFRCQPWGVPFTWPPRFGNARTIWLSLLWMVVALVVGSQSTQWISHLMRRPMTAQDIVPLIKYALNAGPLAVCVSVVIAAPIAEEIIFRGLIYGALEKRFRVTGTILISSAVFALAHLQLAYFVPIFCLGVVLGWARWKTNSLGLPIALHVLNNGLALVVLKFVGKGV